MKRVQTLKSPVMKPHGIRRDSQAVLITGASGGIGRAIARAFGLAGWYVGVHYCRNKAEGEVTLQYVLDAGGSGALYHADIREAESVRRMIDDLCASVSGPLAFVCNAGVGESSLVLRQREESWTDVIATNLTGTFHCLRAMAPVLSAQGGGSIVIVGSYAGYHGAIGQAAYAASKAGLLGLAKTAALEWGPKNLRVNLVLPGWHKTKLSDGASSAAEGWTDHALRRPPSTEEVASTILHLTRLKGLSGQVWNLDSRVL